VKSFAYATARTWEDVDALVADDRFSLPILKAGGMDVVDHLKEGLEAPDLLIDVRQVRSEPGRAAIEWDASSRTIRVEAMATLAEISQSPIVLEHAPVIAQACASAGTPQVRNVATAAGNLLQRPRCWYYRSAHVHCLKKGGHMCYAAEGENKYHAILGGGPCHIVHPSNLAPAGIVCEGVAYLRGGERKSVALKNFFHLPEHGVRTEHELEPGEFITHLTFKAEPRSGFSVVKERQGSDWPLAFACAAVERNGDRISSARVCAGAVAPMPWALPAVE